MSLVVDRSRPRVLVLLLDRPRKRNAIDRPLAGALLDAFDSVSEHAVVLGSTDPACFCAGADLALSGDEWLAASDDLYALYERMVTLPAPIVAAIGGPAIGGGAQLAIASDLRIGTPTTRMRLVGPRHGLAVGAWGLPSLVGRGRALDLCLAMREMGAEEALRIGLLDRIEDDALAAAIGTASMLAALDRGAVGRTKAVVRDVTGLVEALRAERAGNREAPAPKRP